MYKGFTKIDKIKLSAQPPSTFFLAISCSEIPKFYKEVYEKKGWKLKPNEIVFNDNYYLFATVNIRNCISGEIFLPSLLMFAPNFKLFIVKII